MPILTTTIGSYPKPAFVPTPDWFRDETTITTDPTIRFERFKLEQPGNYRALLDRGTKQAILDQVLAGIDVPTDGEIRRENYIHYHCRHLKGFDFSQLTTRTDMRHGTWSAAVPTVVSPIRPGAPFLVEDYRVAQSFTDQPVKMTIPGPLTIMDSTADDYYGSERAWGKALATALNQEAHALAMAGCTWIQIDEPVFARYPDKALDFGIELLDRCFHGLPGRVKRTMHMCCGYPDRVDNEEYPKADPNVYFQLADALDKSTVQFISIEDAHRPNDLSLLERFEQTTIILGVVAIARSRIEPAGEIKARLELAREHIDPNRLMSAPDCGLGMLRREIALAKITNLALAAKTL